MPGSGLLAAGVYQLAAAVAGHFVDMSDPIAFWSCLSASAAAVAVAGMQIHASFTVDPQRWAQHGTQHGKAWHSVFDSTPAVCVTRLRFSTVADLLLLLLLSLLYCCSCCCCTAAAVLQGVPHHDEEAQQACRAAGGDGVAICRCVVDPVECMSQFSIWVLMFKGFFCSTDLLRHQPMALLDSGVTVQDTGC